MRRKEIKSGDFQKKSFPIVGIGGSAGGLEAFKVLLENLSNKSGMAFVFIMHLAPSHKSLLPELLARATKMPVSEITNGMIPEINHVYIKPPNTNLVLSGGKLILSALYGKNVNNMRIDTFFQSLADELAGSSIGVIMSGTATDGTQGAEAIKAAGGITFAQDEKSAKFYDMPKSAISAGCVDFVLSPEKIAIELERIARHPLISSVVSAQPSKPIMAQNKGFESIFDIVRRANGLDFTYYKTATIARRVLRRIVLTKQGSLKNYIKLLRENDNEVGLLYEDLLINVTSFFRDKAAFHRLEKSIIPKIIKNKTKDQGVRIWVPGCSSGEEAYSIAMLITEALGRKAGVIPVNIFATDTSEIAINKARRGVYGPRVKDDVTPGRLKRFFTKEGNNYKISKSLREICIFSKQNVFSDPPFSNIDLISCRNLLIYLQPVLQKKVFHNFHYSLRPGGFLVLGNSESESSYSNLFKVLDNKHKIFGKKYVLRRPDLELGQRYCQEKKLEVKKEIGIKIEKTDEITSVADKIVLSEYAPCGVLIDSSMQIVNFRGHTGRYLESAVGRSSLDIFKLAREGLLIPLRSAIYKADKTKHTVKRETDDVLCHGRKISVMITVVPLRSAVLKERFFLVLFDEIASAAGLKNMPKTHIGVSLKRRSAEKDDYIKDLQKELTETKEYLQTVIEEQENANEEVRTANEEILSSNEELQSTNEELETAKEELQSSNEELTTTNEELQNRNAEVSLLNNDMINLLGSINVPIVMMGMDLVIRRVTPQADKVLNVTSSDVGRPISKVKLNIDIPDFEKTLFDVIESLRPKTFEIKDKDGNWYSVYIRPYRTMDNKIDGVVVIFIDITERKKAQEGTYRLAAIVESSEDAIIGKDLNGIIISWNKGAERLYGYTEKEAVGKSISILVPGERVDELCMIMQKIKEGQVTEHLETLRQKKDRTKFPVSLTFSPIKDVNGKIIGASTIARDITENKKTENDLRKAEELYRTLVNNINLGITLIDKEHNIIMTSAAFGRLFKKDPKEFIGLKCFHEFERRSSVCTGCPGDVTLATGKPAEEYRQGVLEDGSIFEARVSTFPVFDAKGKVNWFIEVVEDVTERKKKAEELKNAYEQLKITQDKLVQSAKMASVGLLAGGVAHEINNPLTGVLNNVQLIKMMVEQNKEFRITDFKELLNLIEESAQRCNKITSSLLGFARASKGVLQNCSLNEMVEKVVILVEHELNLENIVIQKNLASGLPQIKGDQQLFQQVILDIINNAKWAIQKKSGKAGGSITITTRNNPETNSVHLFISDTGIGIPSKNIERIFEPFFTTKEVGEGTGLGLSIVYSIIKEQNGTISAESEEGKGATFKIELPALVERI